MFDPDTFTKRDNEGMRARSMKREGFTDLQIAQNLGISRTTARRRMKEPKKAPEKLIDFIREKQIKYREKLVGDIISSPEFFEFFGRDIRNFQEATVSVMDRDIKIETQDGDEDETNFIRLIDMFKIKVPNYGN